MKKILVENRDEKTIQISIYCEVASWVAPYNLHRAKSNIPEVNIRAMVYVERPEITTIAVLNKLTSSEEKPPVEPIIMYI